MFRKSRIGLFLGILIAIIIFVAGVYPVLAAQPANDDIASATVIGGLPYSDNLDTTEATPDEGILQPGCYYETLQSTVWYKYTPNEDIRLDITTNGSDYVTVTGVFLDIGELSVFGCAYNSTFTFDATAGETYYIVVGATSDQGPYPSPVYGGNLIFTLQEHQLESPEVSFDYWMYGALNYEFYNYSWDPEGYGFETAFWEFGDGESSTDLYSTSHQYSLEGSYDVTLTVTTIDGRTASLTRTIDAFLPQPEAEFYFDPYNPSIFDLVQFHNYSWDPAYENMTAYWDLGDGTTSTDWSVAHQYESDGSYLVSLTVTTEDGRSDTISREVLIETHDVAINQFIVPKNGKVDLTRHLEVGISNIRQTELVRVYLYKSTNDPWNEWIEVGRLTQTVPVREKRTTKFVFTYTFTLEDSEMGKVNFKAEAQILNERDALPGDNTAISRPVKVIP